MGGDWTHTFTSSLINQLRYAFQQSNIAFEAGAIPTCTIASFATCTSAVGLGAPFASYGYGAGLPQGRFVKVNQVQDNATWNHGRHTILFGGEVDYQDSPWGFLPNASGSFNFTPGAATNSAYPNGIPLRIPSSVSNPAAYQNGLTGMLEGVAEVSLAEGSPTIPFKETDFALYFQDDWKVRPGLTLNLGLRYEYFGQSVNYLHNESVARQTGSNPFWSTSLPLSATTVPSVNSYLKNIEPRVGLAYTPSSLPRMVVHAGYTINVDPEFYELFINMATAAPVVDSGTFACDGITVQCLPANGLTFATVQAADNGYLPTGGDPRVYPTQTVPTSFHNPMSQTYTLGFQYQVAPGRGGRHSLCRESHLGPVPGVEHQPGHPRCAERISGLRRRNAGMHRSDAAGVHAAQLQQRRSPHLRQHSILHLQRSTDIPHGAQLSWMDGNCFVHVQPHDRQCE